jgi:hypothetical protein
MGIESFKREASLFLNDNESGVLVVAGKWGVGKTHAWNNQLKDSKTAGRIGLGKYAYVSLFGLTSLEDVKQAIIENTVDRERIGKQPDLSSLQTSVTALTSNWRRGFSLVSSVGPIAEYAAAVSKIGFFFVRNQIICIDDLERKSQSLEIRDILGLISFLKEQRNCKVIVLLNDEALGPDEGDFRKQLEKVADTAVRFTPTPEQAADIAISAQTPLASQFRKDCIALGIVNIRTIKKLERHAKRLQEELQSFDERVIEQALHTLVLLGFGNLQPDVAPSVEFIRKYNQYEGMFGRDKDKPLDHPEWRSLINDFGWSSLDEFDVVIADGLEAGHFDPDQLKAEAEKLQERFRRQDADNSFSRAWDLYHGSFDNNGDEVAEALADAVMTTPEVISPLNLSGTITALKEIGWQGDIAALINAYVNKRQDEARFWDLDESAFGSEVTDPDVRAAFEAKLDTFHDDRDPHAILVEMGSSRAWSHRDIEVLGKLSADDFYALFKRLRRDEHHRAVRGALMFRNSTSEKEARVAKAAIEALKRIGAESPINARRVRRDGMLIDRDFEDPVEPLR